jgi:L-alanine-DL-glutamate epimerase-like enolase superfamily enzyme
MKVVSLETHIVAVPPPHVGGMYWIFVKLKTDCGIEGVGEIYSATFHPKAMTHIIDDVFGRYLLDKDPHHIERLWREAYSSGFTQRPDLTMMGVVSGLEMACWDIIGKAANKPVYELLGGMVNQRLRSYTYLYPKNSRGEYDYDDPDLAAECALENVKRGFTAVKFDPAGPYTAYSGHQLSMEVLDRCETFCRVKQWAARPTCCSARTGRWCLRRRSGSRSDWKNTIRCGLRSRCRRVRKARWRRSRSTPAFRLRPASASPPSTNSSSCSKPAPRRFCN